MISFSPQGRKKIKFIYLLPLFLYLALTTIFAKTIISFIGPCQVEVLYGPIGKTIVYWVYPTLNIGFIIVYIINLLMLLTHWEAVVKFSEKYSALLPLSVFLALIFVHLALFGSWSLSFLKPLCCWLFFILTAYLLGTIIVVFDLQKQFRRAVRKKRSGIQEPPQKNKKKLLLIYPETDLSAGFGHQIYLRLPPLSLGILSALTPREQFSVELIDEQVEPFAYRDADLVAITAYTAHALRAYEIAGRYRQKGIPVVMGGIHASMRTEEALQFVDTVAVGEAEDVWPAILQDFLRGELKPLYQGTYPELHHRVIPDRDIWHESYLVNTIQTSRGCPHNCSFCSVTRFNGRRYRQRPVEKVLDELETIPNRYIFFVDDNLIGYGRAAERRALALFQGMVKRKIKKRWIAQTTIVIGTQPELLKWAARSGCLMLFIGLEFIDKDQLRAMNKGFAAHIDYPDAIKRIHRHGIGIMGAFIYGDELDTKQKMTQRAAFVARKIDAMQQTVLTPIPGSKLYNDLFHADRMLFASYPADWNYYNGLTLLHIPRTMSAREFLITYRYCMNKTYGRFRLWWKALATLFRTRQIEVAAGSLRLNFGYRSFTLRNIQNQIKHMDARPEKYFPHYHQ